MTYTSTRSARLSASESAAQDCAEVEQGRGHQEGGQPQARIKHVNLRRRQVVRQIGDECYRSHPQRPAPVPRHHFEEDIQQADEHEEQEDRARGIEIPRHEGRVHGRIGIRRTNG